MDEANPRFRDERWQSAMEASNVLSESIQKGFAAAGQPGNHVNQSSKQAHPLLKSRGTKTHVRSAGLLKIAYMWESKFMGL